MRLIKLKQVGGAAADDDAVFLAVQTTGKGRDVVANFRLDFDIRHGLEIERERDAADVALAQSCDAGTGTNRRPKTKTGIGTVNVVNAQGQINLGGEVIPSPAAERPEIAAVVGGTEVEII